VDSAPSGTAGHERPSRPGALPGPPGVPIRGPVLRSLGRAVLNTTALLVLYYALPLDRDLSWRTAGWLLGGLVLVGLLVAAQIRAILRAQFPGLRALEALSTSVPLFLLVFASVYEMLDVGAPGSFSESMTRTDALYFVVTVFATVGFGDITAVSETARVLVTLQMVGDLVLIGLVIRAFLSAVEHGRQRRQEERADTAPHGRK
jgi:voltage-gated potassium channel